MWRLVSAKFFARMANRLKCRRRNKVWAEAAVEAAKQGDFEYALTLLRA